MMNILSLIIFTYLVIKMNSKNKNKIYDKFSKFTR
jgi:hypothetical protein